MILLSFYHCIWNFFDNKCTLVTQDTDMRKGNGCTCTTDHSIIEMSFPYHWGWLFAPWGKNALNGYYIDCLTSKGYLWHVRKKADFLTKFWPKKIWYCSNSSCRPGRKWQKWIDKYSISKYKIKKKYIYLLFAWRTWREKGVSKGCIYKCNLHFEKLIWTL